MLTVIHVDGSKKGQTETFQQPVVAVGRDSDGRRHAVGCWQGSISRCTGNHRLAAAGRRLVWTTVKD